MASIQLKPPEPFNFKTPDEWSRWRRRFEQFRVASGLGEESPAKQIRTLLYCLGEEAESVLTSTNATADDRKNYDAVMGKFDAFFQVRRNVIFERARFNRRNQLPGETSEQYIMALYTLAANCNYGALETEMIRDRLVVGIRDNSLSEHLQLDAELTLEKAKTKIRQREAVHEQQNILSGTDTPKLDEVRSYGDRRRQHDRRNYNHTNHKENISLRNATAAVKNNIPAINAQQKMQNATNAKEGALQRTVFHKERLALTNESLPNSNSDTAFLDAARPQTAWFVDIKVGKRVMPFKLDTGAEVTAISKDAYTKLTDAPLLTTTHRTR